MSHPRNKKKVQNDFESRVLKIIGLFMTTATLFYCGSCRSWDNGTTRRQIMELHQRAKLNFVLIFVFMFGYESSFLTLVLAANICLIFSETV